MGRKLNATWSRENGQALTEYAVMLALILVLVFGIVRAVGGKANHVFSTVADDLLHRTTDD